MEGPRRVHFVSLGCPKNRVDSELMAGLVERDGAQLTADPEQADVIVVNTCAFLTSATSESIDTILQLAEQKKHGRCSRLIVTGCMVQRYGDAGLLDGFPEVDAFLGTNELPRIAEAVADVLPKRAYLSKGSHLYNAKDPRLPATRGASTYLKIAEGCNRTCSFCVIPSIRGPQASRPLNDVVDEARTLVESGNREIVLIAQDLTSYGIDFGNRHALEDLLIELNDIESLRWIRLMYCYPWNFTARLVSLIRDCERVLTYIDMPLQHVNERILASMRRSVKRHQQRRLIEKLRAIDGMVLRTTLMVGYPGETETEFNELCDWVRDVEFERLGGFAFSPEEGTPAAAFGEQIPDEIKTARLDQLMAIQQAISLKKNRALLGRELKVLVDGTSEEHEYVLEGRFYGQAPEVDGVVYLSQKEEHGDEPMSVRPGDFVDVVIEEATEYDLKGVMVRPSPAE